MKKFLIFILLLFSFFIITPNDQKESNVFNCCNLISKKVENSAFLFSNDNRKAAILNFKNESSISTTTNNTNSFGSFNGALFENKNNLKNNIIAYKPEGILKAKFHSNNLLFVIHPNAP